ncbi:hypothetical protein CEXT_644151 [Caerostris extrusa]|uniref:Uncharacterized protein n=1 Tax=Caerostris extrusa TaxID=172846 RepID=A0AAV4TYJ8_CAEEX|nr:hypothetical protein CEXT_644151 [Caerostris extrusa]
MSPRRSVFVVEGGLMCDLADRFFCEAKQCGCVSPVVLSAMGFGAAVRSPLAFGQYTVKRVKRGKNGEETLLVQMKLNENS